jgi:hypothetical protein
MQSFYCLMNSVFIKKKKEGNMFEIRLVAT